MRKRGFTLVEILIVVAIIGILAGALLVGINPLYQIAKARDAGRLSAMNQIVKALEMYWIDHGDLPTPSSYGEGSNSPGWWNNWWDVSSFDKNGDGDYFLDFLKDGGYLSQVPVDPLNTPATNNPNEGYRYLFFIAPKGYTYQGGSCVVDTGYVYLLAVRDLETKKLHDEISPGCECLWKNRPDMFSDIYDYVICNTFEKK